MHPAMTDPCPCCNERRANRFERSDMGGVICLTCGAMQPECTCGDSDEPCQACEPSAEVA
jgi:hypothetical protein